MSNDVDVRVLKHTYEPCGQFVSRLPQPGVKRCDYYVEAAEGLIVEIERAVTVHLDLRTGQESDRGFSILVVDLDSLQPQPFDVEPSRDGKPMAMIGDA